MNPDSAIDPSSVNGWQFLARELILLGAPRERVISVLGDKRMPQRTPVSFKLRPRETEQMYIQFTQPARLAVARACLENHEPEFKNAERQFGVSRHVLAALLLIETQCGKFTGNSLVLERLARVSSVSEPVNVDFNFSQLSQTDSSVTREAVQARARYLQETFLPEVKALLSVAEVKGIDVFDLRGSVAGAFGLPQFLPSSYLRYGVDGNADGKVDLFNPQDAIPSTANYLRSFGWDENAPVHDKKKVLWNYNRSDAYGDAVLKVSILLRQSTQR
jgi:membrane-bound lytic murein transglycosylase B